MSSKKFRSVKASEVEVRVGTCKEKGVSLLLYKDARCDMNILDETVGCMNWQREHSRDNKNCKVGIYSEELMQWVYKEDTGTESYTEKEKGLASDSFKRACVNWGIGRELYTAPFIWANVPTIKTNKNDKYNNPIYKCNEKFSCYHLVVEDGYITELGIQDSQNNPVFKWKNKNK